MNISFEKWGIMRKRLVSILLSFALCVYVVACGSTKNVTNEDQVRTEEVKPKFEIEGASYIELSDELITVNGEKVSKNEEAAVYVANDIVYYEEGKDFTYGEGSKKDEHSKEEADKHRVVHITEPGTYVLRGSLSAGQIAVDLGKDADDDPEAVVTLALDNVDITCSVAPAVIFYNVYECGDSDKDEATKDVDTSEAGANILIPDGTDNTIRGSYVAKIYKSVELNEAGTEVVDSKKLHKYDAAFYSKMSMNIDGGEENTGRLNIYAENEGVGTELHLTMNGGTVNIISGNDGINTNEEKVSVTTINDGWLNIRVDGGTGEGDGIDSNGWLVINGGVVHAAACSTSMDAGIDSDKGIHINGGTVVATGNMLDHIAESEQNYVVFNFRDKIKAGEEIALVKDEESHFLSMPNDYTYLVVSKASFGEEGTYTLWRGEEQLQVVEISGGDMMPPASLDRGKIPDEFVHEMPEGFEPGQKPGGRGGRDFGQINVEDAVMEFEIKEGGNMYMVVSNRI